MKKIINFIIIILFIITVNNITSDETYNGNPYTGYLRIYLTEIESNINMYNGEPYHFALSDIPYEKALSLDYLESFEETINFNGNVGENNLMLMAAVFNPESQTNYADPPIGAPFDAYFVDASVGARSGETSSNIINGNFTHTIFIEEGTATWCPSCPAAGEVLYSIYESGDYPFYYIAMVVDKNEVADNRMNDYNVNYIVKMIKSFLAYSGNKNNFIFCVIYVRHYNLCFLLYSSPSFLRCEAALNSFVIFEARDNFCNFIAEFNFANLTHLNAFKIVQLLITLPIKAKGIVARTSNQLC